MTQKSFFASLDAPLVNARWSWGAISFDGAVFLRVWQDEVRTHEGSEFALVWRERSVSTSRMTHGRRERQRHVDLIKGGTKCYLILCAAEDPTEKPRRVRQFNSREIFPGGRLQERDGGTWVQLLPSIRIEDFLSKRAGR